jgi:transcription antitermination protein NusB
MSKRRNARELTLKVLFQIDVGKLPIEEVLETSLEEVKPSPEDWQFVEGLVRGVLSQEAELDRHIGELAEGWRLERLARVDKNVLRVALYELAHDSDTAVSVIINDAVEIAKKYSTEDSGRFVNGILGSYLKKRGRAGFDTSPTRQADADE